MWADAGANPSDCNRSHSVLKNDLRSVGAELSGNGDNEPRVNKPKKALDEMENESALHESEPQSAVGDAQQFERDFRKRTVQR
jgi:hypothetical protein